MGATVEIPVWLLALGALGLAVAVLDRLVAPTFRWYFRRRLERAVERLNRRLSLRIQPFRLMRRAFLVERLGHDPEVMRAVEAHVAETGMPRDIAHRLVEEYAREIVPSFSAFMYFGVGARLCRWVAEALYKVRLGAFDRAALAEIDPEAAVVFVINHRSNVDYLLVTHLASGAASLSYAVGEWARIWPLSRVIRNMGAYFIRRRERGALYRTVLRRYVQMAVEGGVTQAVFPEGGLSRDGGPGAPKLGILSYIAEAKAERDVIFVPVGVNYDRVLEDRLLLSAYGPHGAGRFKVKPRVALGFLLGWALGRLTGRASRFGYAAVGFGAPLRLGGFAGGPEALGAELMRRIGAATPVLPVGLVAAALEAGAADRPALAAAAEAHARLLEAAGAHFVMPKGGLPAAVEAGLAQLLLRRIVAEEAGRLTVRDAPLLAFYARSAAPAA